MKLYVKNITRKPNDTLYTFLEKVLRLKNNFNAFSTVSYTYFDSEFKELQCNSGKHRSFDDLVLISKTYFKVSDKIVARAIKKILDENNTLIFVLCDSANKWVLNNSLTKSETLKYCAKYNKSDYKTDDSGIGKYSFKNIMNLAGLTEEDIKINN